MLTPPASLMIYVATQPVDFRNYVERRIMRGLGGFPETKTGVFGRSTPHNFGRSLAAEHGQELVRWSEPPGPEVRRRGDVQCLQFLGGVSPNVNFGGGQAAVPQP